MSGEKLRTLKKTGVRYLKVPPMNSSKMTKKKRNEYRL
jgi:hypothetical protein